MSEKQEVELWGGWSITLPAANHQRNEDGSWSAWGIDWAVDVHIIEVGGDAAGAPIQPETLLGADRKTNTSGPGWIGMTEVVKEVDGGREVFRLAGRLAAVNTLMSCWVSYLTEQQQPFAEDLIRRVVHHGPSTTQGNKP